MSSDASVLKLADSQRNLVLCFDGTGDWVGFDETNVAQIFLNLQRDDLQVSFYDGGVGTLTNPQALTVFQRVALRLLDLGVATGLRDKVLNGYAFLIRNYKPGDRIFMFGFSRGAFTARLVASMVENFGIPRPEHENLAPYLWQTLESIPPGRQAEVLDSPIGEFKRTAAHLKKEFSEGSVEIEFLGLFDTVSSVGIVRRFNVYPNTDHNPSVKRVCHVVSIDEQRNAFPESLFHPQQRGLTEVWFPGVHRDAGGGLPHGRRRIADEALAWVETEAQLGGVRFKRRTEPCASEPPAPNYPSYDPYVPLGLYPMKMFVKRVSGFRFIWPNFRHIRLIPENVLIHQVVHALLEEGKYDPVNLPKSFRTFPKDADLPRATRFSLPTAAFQPKEVVGTLVGTALMVLLWNGALVNDAGKGPLGVAWPPSEAPYAHCTKGVVLGLGIAFLFSLFLGQRYTDRMPRANRLRPEGILPMVGAIVLAAFVVTACRLGWTAYWAALGSGAIVSGVSQWPGLPTLPSERAMPYVLWGWTGALSLAFVLGKLGIVSEDAQIGLLALAGLAVLVDLIAERRGIRRAELDDDEHRRERNPIEASRRRADA